MREGREVGLRFAEAAAAPGIGSGAEEDRGTARWVVECGASRSSIATKARERSFHLEWMESKATRDF